MKTYILYVPRMTCTSYGNQEITLIFFLIEKRTVGLCNRVAVFSDVRTEIFNILTLR